MRLPSVSPKINLANSFRSGTKWKYCRHSQHFWFNFRNCLRWRKYLGFTVNSGISATYSERYCPRWGHVPWRHRLPCKPTSAARTSPDSRIHRPACGDRATTRQLDAALCATPRRLYPRKCRAVTLTRFFTSRRHRERGATAKWKTAWFRWSMPSACVARPHVLSGSTAGNVA